MGTLSDQDTIDSFAAGAKEVYKHWQQNTAIANENAIVNLLRAAVRNTTVHPLSYSFRDFSNGSGGQLTSQGWILEINRAYTNEHALPVYLFKWLCGILYHEARHAEQYFCCAQGVHEGDLVLPTPLSGVGTMSQQIGAAMGISDNAVTAAENVGSYRLKSQGEKNTIRAWFDSVWGAQRGHRSTVYTMPNLFTLGSAGNIAYTSLPEEVDAYAVQAAVETAVDNAIAGVTQIVVADSAPVSTLKTAVTSVPVSGPKPVVSTNAIQGVSSLASAFTAPTGLPLQSSLQPTVGKNTVSSLVSLFSK
jgi:hypothetical protein